MTDREIDADDNNTSPALVPRGWNPWDKFTENCVVKYFQPIFKYYSSKGPYFRKVILYLTVQLLSLNNSSSLVQIWSKHICLGQIFSYITGLDINYQAISPTRQADLQQIYLSDNQV